MGLATNSSSIHSIILMAPKHYRKVRTDEYYDFGWSFFTAANIRSKTNYLAYILRGNLNAAIGEENAAVIIDALFESKHGGSYSKEIEENGYGVDHQSFIGLPRNWDGQGINLDFFKDFKDYIVNNPVAILGGNDNTDESHPLRGDGKSLDLGILEDGEYGTLVARKDHCGRDTHWVLFNRHNGTKVRLTFDHYPNKRGTSNPIDEKTFAARKFMLGPIKPFNKAAAPELVDIKITDHCTMGCEYCYQSSTPAGQHADYDNINRLAYALARMRVFEVALGGGEPTKHPKFLGILRTFRNYGVIPNFTTRDLMWMFNKKDAQEIVKTAGEFAYSVTTGADVKRLGRAIERGKFRELQPEKEFSVQYVLNTGGNLYDVLEEARKNDFRVTLLGYKRVGFGKDFTPIPEDWMKAVAQARKERSWVHIGVDTAIIKEQGEQIKRDLNVSELLMTAEEGKFSMYINAVNNTMGPSSYCSPDEMEPIIRGQGKTTEDYIRERFIRW
jgi:MoaA/NifB/PqqE/SkfB family radical SAM enzyme